MKLVACLLLFLFISATFAQITFTREWVKGKRSTTANSPAGLPKDGGHLLCRNLMSAVEYLLIELDRVRKAECSECCHSAPPSTYPILPDIQRSPSDFMMFLRDMPEQVVVDQPERQGGPSAATTERRNQ